MCCCGIKGNEFKAGIHRLVIMCICQTAVTYAGLINGLVFTCTEKGLTYSEKKGEGGN